MLNIEVAKSNIQVAKLNTVFAKLNTVVAKLKLLPMLSHQIPFTLPQLFAWTP